MKYIKLILITILILSNTGCYNYRELNDLGITTAIGITKKEQYEITIEVLKTEKEDVKESDMPKYVIFTTKGKTIQEALRNTILESSKRLYAHHLLVLVIDKTLAEEGISDIIDLFFRDPESRKQFYVIIADEDIKDILNTKTPLKDINAQSLYERIKVNDSFLGNMVPTTFSSLLSKYVNPNIEITLPIITLKDERIIFNNTAVFKKDKLIGQISNDYTTYYNLICDNINDTILTTNDNDNYITIEINNSKTKYKVDDNVIDILINLTGNIAEVNSNIDLTRPESITYIEKLFESDLNNKIKKMIDYVITKYDTDIFGFKDLLYKNSKSFNDLKALKINIATNLKLKYKGNGAYELNEK